MILAEEIISFKFFYIQKRLMNKGFVPVLKKFYQKIFE